MTISQALALGCANAALVAITYLVTLGIVEIAGRRRRRRRTETR